MCSSFLVFFFPEIAGGVLLRISVDRNIKIWYSIRIHALKGKFYVHPNLESARLVKGYAGNVNGRPGADCLNIGRGVRVCPLQLLSARVSGNSGGTAEF